MNAWLTAFCVGVIILYWTGTLLPLRDVVAFIFCINTLAHIVLVFCIFKRFKPRFAFRKAFFCLGALVFGYLYATSHALDYLDERLPESLTGSVVKLKGYVCSLPKNMQHSTSVDLCLSQGVDVGGAFLMPRSRVRLYLDERKLGLLSPGFKSAHVRLKAPRGKVNFYAFDQEQAFFFQRVSAVATVRKLEAIVAPEGALLGNLRSDFVSTRWQLDKVLQAWWADHAYAGVLRALSIGEKSEINAREQYLLERTGTQHLVAISGLHVAVFLVFFARHLPVRWYGLLGVLLVGLGYVLIVGFPGSAQRAWLMGALALLVARGYLRVSVWRAYLFAMFMVLLLDPLAPLSLGFWYSFASVLLILLVHQSGYLSLEKPVQSFVVLQCFFALMLAIPNGFFSIPHGLVSVVANGFAIPWISLLVLPLALLGSVLALSGAAASEFVLRAADEALYLMFALFEALVDADVPVKVLFDPVGLGALLCMLLALLFYPGSKTKPAFILCAFVVYLFIPSRVTIPSAITIFDSGQGLAVLLEDRAGDWIYDLGPAHGGSGFYSRGIRPYILATRNAPVLQGMVLSHGDNDHVGAYERALAELQPAHLLSGEPGRLPAGQFEPCVKGFVWRGNDLSFEVLYPNLQSNPDSANNHSCVLMVSMAGKRILLMGDVEAQGEREFLRSVQKDIRADVLVAGHHGSNHASRYALLKRVRPEYLVVSAGYANRFGHPHSEVKVRAGQFGAKVLETASLGAIQFELRNDELVLRSARTGRGRFWLSPPLTDK